MLKLLCRPSKTLKLSRLPFGVLLYDYHKHQQTRSQHALQACSGTHNLTNKSLVGTFNKIDSLVNCRKPRKHANKPSTSLLPYFSYHVSCSFAHGSFCFHGHIKSSQDTSGRIVSYDLVSGSMMGVLALGDTVRQTKEELPTSSTNEPVKYQNGSETPGITWTGSGNCLAVAVSSDEVINRK